MSCKLIVASHNHPLTVGCFEENETHLRSFFGSETSVSKNIWHHWHHWQSLCEAFASACLEEGTDLQARFLCSGRTVRANGRWMFLWPPILQLNATEFFFQLALLWETWVLKLNRAVGHADPSFFVQKILRGMVSTTKNPIKHVFRDPCATSLISTHPQLCASSFRDIHLETSDSWHERLFSSEKEHPEHRSTTSKALVFKFHVLCLGMPKTFFF